MTSAPFRRKEATSATNSRGPLAGIRVIETTHMVMGPTCGMMLADLGADVVKVEPLGGDKTRSLGGMGSAFFPFFNRNKRSFAVDLEREEGRAIVRKLVQSADVFLENFRDGTAERMGLDYKTLSALNPRLIHGSLKGFLAGPYKTRPALDEVVQMMTGLSYMTGSMDTPMRVGSSVNDIMGGMFGVIAVLAALRERDESGIGREVRIGLFETCLMLVGQHMVQYDLTGKPATPMAKRTHAWPVYDIFDAAGGGRIFVAVVTEGHWRAFCKAFGRLDLLDHADLQSRGSRIEARHWLIPTLRESLAARTADEIARTCEEIEIPFAEIMRPEDMFADPHVLYPGALASADDPTTGRRFRSPALPIEFDGQRVNRADGPPKLGEATCSVLVDWGIPPDEVADLLASRVLESADSKPG